MLIPTPDPIAQRLAPLDEGGQRFVRLRLRDLPRLDTTTTIRLQRGPHRPPTVDVLGPPLKN
jgi:hypothetical protein